MEVKTRGSKNTIDPPILSLVEDDMRKDNEIVEASGVLLDNTIKEVELCQKVVRVPRHPPPSPQRLVRKTKDGKHQQFMIMLNQFSMNLPLIEA